MKINNKYTWNHTINMKINNTWCMDYLSSLNIEDK